MIGVDVLMQTSSLDSPLYNGGVIDEITCSFHPLQA